MPGCGHGHGGMMMKGYGGMMKGYGGMMKGYGGAHKKVKSESRKLAEAEGCPLSKPVLYKVKGKFHSKSGKLLCRKAPKKKMTPSQIQSLLRRASAATKPRPLLAKKVPSKQMSPLMTHSQAARALSQLF